MVFSVVIEFGMILRYLISFLVDLKEMWFELLIRLWIDFRFMVVCFLMVSRK